MAKYLYKIIGNTIDGKEINIMRDTVEKAYKDFQKLGPKNNFFRIEQYTLTEKDCTPPWVLLEELQRVRGMNS